MFDLNGFKQYNDTFGHGAGDALLARLGERLAAVVNRRAPRTGWAETSSASWHAARRMAGEGLLAAAASALADQGEGWSIDCSYGATWIPSEANTPSDALRNADRRMYANKASRSSASRQLTDVLLQVLSEQDTWLDAHADHVAELAGQVAEPSVSRTTRSTASGWPRSCMTSARPRSPAPCSTNPGRSTHSDWEFMHRHTLVGERIVLAAPALAHTAP